MVRRTALGVLGAVAAVVLVWPVVVGAPAASPGAPPALETVVNKVTKELAAAKGVYHATERATSTGSAPWRAATIQQWVDARRGVVREQLDVTDAGDEAPVLRTVAVTTGGKRYDWYLPPGESMPAPTCRGASVATSAVLGCPSSYRSPHLEVTTGTFGGSAAVVLVTRQTVSTADGDLRIERRLALDPTTFFPIGSDESDTLAGDLTTRRSSLHSVISHDFVPYGGLARDFFTASATTVSDDRQLDAAARGDTLYWLGRTLAPSGSYPALALWRIEPGPTSSSLPTGVGPPRYRAIIRYRPTSDPSGPPTVAIFTWPPDDWARVHGIPTSPCVGAPPPPDLGVPVAVSCSATDVEAVVVYPDAVVHLIASAPTERGQSANPYAAPNGMALLLRALQPRA